MPTGLMENPLFVFDFDDTLIGSNGIIRIIHADGQTSSLTTDEFARYRVGAGETLQFDEYSILDDDIEVLPLFGRLLDALDDHGPNAIVVLTARSKPGPPRQILRRLGVTGIDVVALGTADLGAKARWLRQKIDEDDHDVVFFYDDNGAHVEAVERLARRRTDVDIFATKV